MIKGEQRKQVKSVRCPYVPEHIMPESSLLNHLYKCTFPNKHLFAKCKYNPIHVYPKDNLQNHYKHCNDRKKFEKQKPVQSDDSWGAGTQSDEQETLNTQASKIQKKKEVKPNQNINLKTLNQSSIHKQKLNESSVNSSKDWISIVSDNSHIQDQSMEASISKSIKRGNNRSNYRNKQFKQDSLQSIKQKQETKKQIKDESLNSQSILSYDVDNSQDRSIKEKSKVQQSKGFDSQSFSYDSQEQDNLNKLAQTPKQKQQKNKKQRKQKKAKNNKQQQQKNNSNILHSQSDQDKLQVDDF